MLGLALLESDLGHRMFFFLMSFFIFQPKLKYRLNDNNFAIPNSLTGGGATGGYGVLACMCIYICVRHKKP